MWRIFQQSMAISVLSGSGLPRGSSAQAAQPFVIALSAEVKVQEAVCYQPWYGRAGALVTGLDAAEP